MYFLFKSKYFTKIIDNESDDPGGDYLVGHDIKCLRRRIHFASDCGRELLEGG